MVFLWNPVIIPTAVAKCSKNAEQKIHISRNTTKAYCRMVRKMTQTNGFMLVLLNILQQRQL